MRSFSRETVDPVLDFLDNVEGDAVQRAAFGK